MWSPCQWVLIRKRGAPAPMASISFRIAGAKRANWSSIISTPSSPTETPMLPAMPESSMCTVPATAVVVNSGSCGSRAAAASPAPRARKAVTAIPFMPRG